VKLGFVEVLVICIGTIIGTGIFLVPGLVAGLLGPGSLLIWIIIALLSIPMGFCFAELASMFTRSGGPVIFVKTAFGPFWGFMAGWTAWTLATVTISSLAIAISFYSSAFFALNWLQRGMIALLAIVAFTLINYIGIKVGARIQILLTAATLALLMALLALGAPAIKLENFLPLWPFGLGALGIAAAITLEPFIGWEACTIISGEVRAARKYIPSAIAITTVLVATVSVALAFVALGAAGWSALAASVTPLAEIAGAVAPFAIAAALIINITCLNSWILTTARLPYALAKERLFLPYFGKLSAFNTPGRALALQALLAAVIAAAGSYRLSIVLLLSNALILYILCFSSLIKLRKSIDAKFRAPRLFPHISLAAAILLFAQLEPAVIMFGILIAALGIPGYIAIKLVTDRAFIEKFWNRLAIALDVYLGALLSGIREHVLAKAELSKSHTVLDYGCGAGTLTLAAAARSARVVAADISEKQLKIAIKRIAPKLPNVIFVKTTRPAPFPPRSFDRIICTVAINYFVHPELELAALRRVLKPRGKAVFLALMAPGIITHPFLRADRTIKSTFATAGWRDIKLDKIKKLGREYIYITAGR
jgi:amino acid transporter